MAERLEELVVKIDSNGFWLDVWCESDLVDRITAIEGVVSVSAPDRTNGRTVWIDQRYSASDITVEIGNLLK